MSKGNLTTKQRLFVEAYLGVAHGNATESARLAGYSGDDNTLSQRGHELVRNSNIAILIERRVTEAAMPANEVLRELSEIGKAPWQEFCEIRLDGDGEVLSVKMQLKDKIKALELLGKHHRLFDRAGEAVDLLSEAKKAVAEFLAKHPGSTAADIAPIYAQTFGVQESELIQ